MMNQRIIATMCTVFGALCTVSNFLICVHIYRSGYEYCGMGKTATFGLYEPVFITIFWFPFLSFWFLLMQFGALIAAKVILIKGLDVESLRVGRGYGSNSDHATTISVLLSVATMIMLVLRINTLSNCH